MKRYILVYILLLGTTLCNFLQAQNTINSYGDRTDEFGNIIDQYGNQVDPSTRPERTDTSNVEKEGLPPTLYMWHISEDLGNITRIAADTIRVNFQNTNLNEGMYGQYNYLGNLGSPRMSRIYFDRESSGSSIFLDPYTSFYLKPSQFKFTNSNVPYTNLTYYTAGNKINGEERFKAYFSVNVNKDLAFGVNFDYVYGRGYYNHSSTSLFNAIPFISYIGERYEASFMYNYNYLKNNENGGIKDDRYITQPEEMAEGRREVNSTDIPTVMNSATNRNKSNYIFLTHRYKLGFYREIEKEKNDTLPAQEEYVPVTSFIHTMKVDWSKHKFTSEDQLTDFYPNNYIDPENPFINDSTHYVRAKNSIGISLLEGFNKYAKAGLTAFVSHQISKYSLMNTDLKSVDKYTENEIFVGGEFAKRQGNLLHYRAWGEAGIAGKAIGQFRVKGDIDLNFKLGKDTVSLIAKALIQNELPDFYMRHYHSKHYFWDNPSMKKVFQTRFQGELNIERWRTNLKFGIENVKNYTYFNQEALPAQHDGNIQIMSAALAQDFKLGILHLDNIITWQRSSNNQVLPLPDWSLYHNLYLDFKLAKKVLSVQLGADVRYFTTYHAPAYNATTSQFHLQKETDKVSIGGYPIIDVYANLHLKRTRIFVMAYHINQLLDLGNGKAFYVPHHPINPFLLKIGISWNFYD